MQTETQEFITRLTPEERLNLYAGLKRRHQQQTALDALQLADLLAHYLGSLGLDDDYDQVRATMERIRRLA